MLHTLLRMNVFFYLAILSFHLNGAYSFLGNLRSFEQTSSGIILTCEDDIRLKIEFLKPEMFRVTLIRPDHEAGLLDYPLAKTAFPPVDLQFQEKDVHLRLISTEIEVLIHKMPCRITVLDKKGNVINRDDPGIGVGWDGNEVRCWKSLGKDEMFFGLGEKTGDLNKRGREWVMWNSDTPGYDYRTDPVYQSIPFYMGLHKGQTYGIYFNNSYRTVFNMGAGNERYASFSADGGALDYFFIYGPKISRVVSTFTELTGRAFLPPKWGLGYQQCRWSYYPESKVLSLAREFREKNIPADVIYLDIHYMDGYRVFTWDPHRFPDPDGMLQKLRAMGFKIVTIIDPGVKADKNYPIAREGLAGDHFLKYPDGETYVGQVWPGRSFFPDFSKPETRVWWGNHLGKMLDAGVAGFWNDMNEPAVWGQAFPNEVLADDNGQMSNFKKMHNLYGFLMSKAAREAFQTHRPGQRPFIVTRAGFAGEQRYTAVWTGDNSATFDDLELGIRMMLGLGLSGAPFVGTDVGGFIGTPSRELYARWIQIGAFSPFFRTHTEQGSSAQEPWSFGEEVERISRKFIELRYRLLPYFYTLMWEAAESGSPVLRPMFWHYPDEPHVYDHAWQHQFLVGENLLIAPVTREKARLKKVWLPKGKWLDLNTEKVYDGRQAIIVDAPLDRLPMFLRNGGMLPSRPATQFVGEKPADLLTLDVFAKDEYANFVFYEDDGETMAYRDGAFRLTQFELNHEKDHFTFSANPLNDGFAAEARQLEIRIHAIDEAPGRVVLNNQILPEVPADSIETAGYFYDSAQKILRVRFSNLPDGFSLMIQ